MRTREICLYPTFEEWKLTLWFLHAHPGDMFISYLWGMKTNGISFLYLEIIGLYPTFEEWKLILIWIEVIISLGLYPTFEEWKHSVCSWSWLTVIIMFISYLWGMKTIQRLKCILYKVNGLYPTFEEWKL